MSKNNMQIEGIPTGYKMTAYRQPVAGDVVVLNDGSAHTWTGGSTSSARFPILEKIDTGFPMSEFPMDKYNQHQDTDNCLFYVDGEWIEGYGRPAAFLAYEDGVELNPLGWKPKSDE